MCKILTAVNISFLLTKKAWDYGWWSIQMEALLF